MGVGMTDVAADLATLAAYVESKGDGDTAVMGLLDRVDAELARLTQERDAWCKTAHTTEQIAKKQRLRAEAAERALEALELRAEVAEAQADQAKAALAETREALAELLYSFPIADPYGSMWEPFREAQDRARRALAASAPQEQP